MPETHFEPFVHLVDVTHDRALLAWGGFWFRRGAPGGRWQVVGDGDLARLDGSRTASIGASSQPYGSALVEVLDAAGDVVARAATDSVNHVWVEGLRPDTAYGYRITVDGRPWAAGPRMDWGPAPRGGLDLVPGGRAYRMRFRTHPSPDVPAPLDLAVIGDYGIGVLADTEAGRRQRRVAEVLDRLVDEPGVRLVLTLGDNVYPGLRPRGSEGSGGRDADWYGSFYQPYRHALAQVPVYPTVGNHDSSDKETSDDREQIRDNFHTAARFTPEVAGPRASVDPGMFYRSPSVPASSSSASTRRSPTRCRRSTSSSTRATTPSSRRPSPLTARGRGGGCPSRTTRCTAPGRTTGTPRRWSSTWHRCSPGPVSAPPSRATSTTSSTRGSTAPTTSSPAPAASCARSRPSSSARRGPCPGRPRHTCCTSASTTTR